MFKTTRNLPGGVLDAVNAMGGNSNASTLFDYTDYYITVHANQLEGMLWLEGERMRNLVIDDKVFHSERDDVQEGVRQRGRRTGRAAGGGRGGKYVVNWWGVGTTK